MSFTSDRLPHPASQSEGQTLKNALRYIKASPGPPENRSSHCTYGASDPVTANGTGVCPAAAACTEHLASTYNRQGLVGGSQGGPLEHPPLLFLSSEQGSARLRGRASTDRPDPPGHALSRMCSACQPQARLAAILGPPPGPQTRLARWGLEGAPRGHPARTEGNGCPLGARTELAPGPRAHAFPGRRHVNTCAPAGPGRVRGRADRVCPTSPRL